MLQLDRELPRTVATLKVLAWWGLSVVVVYYLFRLKFEHDMDQYARYLALPDSDGMALLLLDHPSNGL
jgi:cbb3-type cytochrome oxidase subunit 3